MDENRELQAWCKKHEVEPFQLWQEAIAHMRHFHSDAANRITFYFTVNSLFLFALIMLIFSAPQNVKNVIQIFQPNVASALLGNLFIGMAAVLNTVAYITFRRSYWYYLHMFLRKTLLEEQLKINEIVIVNNWFLSFPPWAEGNLAEMKSNPRNWITGQVKVSTGTVGKLLKAGAWLGIVIYFILLLYVNYRLYCTGIFKIPHVPDWLVWVIYGFLWIYGVVKFYQKIKKNYKELTSKIPHRGSFSI